MALISMTFSAVPALMTLIFPAFVTTGGVLNPRRVFTVLSLVSALRIYASGFLTRAVFTLSEGLVAVSRLKVGCVLTIVM